MTRSTILVAAACLALAATSRADTIKIRGTNTPVNGTIRHTTPREVEIETNRGVPKTVQVNDIESVHYADEPGGLGEARKKIAQGDYDGAAQALDSLKLEGKQDEESSPRSTSTRPFAPPSRRWAATAILWPPARAWPPSRSIIPTATITWKPARCWATCWWPRGSTPRRKSITANWPTPRGKTTRCGPAAASAAPSSAQGKTAEALTAFEEVLGNETVSDQAEPQRRLATLGKARCLAAGKRFEEAVKLAQKIIGKLDADETRDDRLSAEAYNTLGTALRKAGRPKDALIAFLHVEAHLQRSPRVPRRGPGQSRRAVHRAAQARPCRRLPANAQDEVSRQPLDRPRHQGGNQLAPRFRKGVGYASA